MYDATRWTADRSAASLEVAALLLPRLVGIVDVARIGASVRGYRLAAAALA